MAIDLAAIFDEYMAKKEEELAAQQKAASIRHEDEDPIDCLFRLLKEDYKEFKKSILEVDQELIGRILSAHKSNLIQHEDILILSQYDVSSLFESRSDSFNSLRASIMSAENVITHETYF